jgi:hypothetical protein
MNGTLTPRQLQMLLDAEAQLQIQVETLLAAIDKAEADAS